jgi:Tfp pilus assembly protein PilO
MIQFEQLPLPPDLPPWVTLPPEVVAIVAVAVVVGTVLLIAPLVRAFARRIEGSGSKAIRAELEETRRRLDAMEQQALTSGEVEASFHRLEEVEERLDFMERVLSSGKENAAE